MQLQVAQVFRITFSMVHLIPSLWTWWKIIWSLWTYKTCITSATYQIEDFIVAVIFLFYLSEIANKTSQIENTMVTCLRYPIIKLLHHTLYDWAGLICRFWSLPGSSSDVPITATYCRFKRSIKC